ncbi:hypothetical protein CQW23_22747 [Capsicum baccatum]|uniref:Uncharacterized protein n=1 Tax=Capsicum baccatum TaxID=33114 RepID=A0A2G2W1S5_CAPBA|nr:hypothetical protein CQW23_22747 [Capsicum baccatum]
MINSCPRVLEYDAIRKWEGGIRGLEEGSNLSSLAIRNILEVSVKFELDYDCVLGSLKCLKDLGVSAITLNKVLETHPMVTTMCADKIHDSFEFAIDAFGVGNIEFDHILRIYPGVLAFGIQNKFKRLLDEFKVLGFNKEVIKKQLLRDPRILALEVGELSRCLELLKSLKCRESYKKDIFHDGDFKAGYEVKLRVDCLRNHGITLRDAYGVLWKQPRVILYHVEDVEKKIEFLVHVMKIDIQYLVEVPECLGMNFEEHILPRFKVIDHLRSIGLGDSRFKLIKPSRMKFYNLYVKPYPECEAMYGRFARNTEVRRQHPAGMWKLSKPPNNPKSREDIMNIKSKKSPASGLKKRRKTWLKGKYFRKEQLADDPPKIGSTRLFETPTRLSAVTSVAANIQTGLLIRDICGIDLGEDELGKLELSAIGYRLQNDDTQVLPQWFPFFRGHLMELLSL